MKDINFALSKTFAFTLVALFFHALTTAQTSPEPPVKEPVEISDEDMALFDSLFEEESRILGESIRRNNESIRRNNEIIRRNNEIIRRTEETIRRNNEIIYFNKISTELILRKAADSLQCNVNPTNTGCIDSYTKKSLKKLNADLEEIRALYGQEDEKPLSTKQANRRQDLVIQILKRLKTFDPDLFSREKPESLKNIID